ncbi:MAG: GMC family oxidoreductase [Gammaproteobacteria bacterium]|nr:GMC family oxidoreductase [Gammaproteobacteria bacterium]
MPTLPSASLESTVVTTGTGAASPGHLDADVIIIGSGIGGACVASALAAGGHQIILLERGEWLRECPQSRDETAIFADGFFRPEETWVDQRGKRFNPGNYYFVGGNSKFYGAAMLRLREHDFGAVEHLGGVSPAWPIDYATLAPWYRAAEELFQVRGDATVDPTEPPRDEQDDYDYPPVADERAIAEVRRRLQRAGVTPSPLPLAVDVDAWLARAPTPWDSFPDTVGAKLDAETAPLAAALRHDNARIKTGARVTRLLTGADNSITAVEYRHAGKTKRLSAKVTVLSAGAVNSAALLLRSANATNPAGLANRSGQVGRNLMNHHASALLAFNPRWSNDAVYQKTLHFNDFYLRGGPGPADNRPLGNVQLLGKLSAGILAALSPLPRTLAGWSARHALGWYAITEDLPAADNRVTVGGDGRDGDGDGDSDSDGDGDGDSDGDCGDIRIAYRRTNWRAHELLVARAKAVFRRAGFPLTLSRAFDFRTPSHQCGTTRFGDDPADSVLNTFCRAHEHPNLFVVDAGFMPSSAAVNPALTIAAQALRVGAHLRARLEAGGDGSDGDRNDNRDRGNHNHGNPAP